MKVKIEKKLKDLATVKTYDDHVSKTVQVVEKDAKDAPVKDVLWNAQEAQTEAVPMIDPGIGDGVILRSFFFKAAPVPKGFRPPTKVQIISHYKKLIETMLWKDGMTALAHRSPVLNTYKETKRGQLKMKMKDEGADFVIMVLAQARAGVTITDQARKI